MNNIVGRNMCLKLKATSPPPGAAQWEMQSYAKWISSRWPCTIGDKALALATHPLFSCCIFFLFLLCALGDLDVLQHASKGGWRPFFLLSGGFHTWGPWYLVCAWRVTVTAWKGVGLGLGCTEWGAAAVVVGCGEIKREPWLNTVPAPRREREGLPGADPRGTNLPWHNRTVHKQRPWELSGGALSDSRGWVWENKGSQSFVCPLVEKKNGNDKREHLESDDVLLETPLTEIYKHNSAWFFFLHNTSMTL